MKTKDKKSKKRSLAVISYVLLITLLALLLWAQRSHLRSTGSYLAHADLIYVLAGVGAMAASLGLSAAMYVILSPTRLIWRQTLLIQAAGMFVNKLLPAGSGALGVNYLYLRKQKIDRVTGVAIVALNNILGSVGHLLLFGVICIVLRQDIRMPSGVARPGSLLVWLAVLLLVLAIVLAALLRKRIVGFMRNLRQTVLTPRRIGPALGCSMLITTCYWLCLLAACSSVGLHISLFVAFLALTVSVFASSILPTPGGVGAAEAGVYAALVAYGVPQSQALAAAVLYRVMTFWIPLFIGSLAFVIAQRRKLIV